MKNKLIPMCYEAAPCGGLLSFDEKGITLIRKKALSFGKNVINYHATMIDYDGKEYEMSPHQIVWVVPDSVEEEARTPAEKRRLSKKCTDLFTSDTMEPTRHPVDGKYYTSQAKFRAATKAHGCEEVGNEYAKGYGEKLEREREKRLEARAEDFAKTLADNINLKRRVVNGRFEN